jgi:hypothetical protein
MDDLRDTLCLLPPPDLLLLLLLHLTILVHVPSEALDGYLFRRILLCSRTTCCQRLTDSC